MSAVAQALAFSLSPLPLLRRALGGSASFVATGAARAVNVTRLLAIFVPARRTVALPSLEGPVVAHCRRGALWITYDGELRDVILHAGQSCTLARQDGIVVHALKGDGIVELETRR